MKLLHLEQPMNDLTADIQRLDDPTAERILNSIARQRLRSGVATELEPTPDLAREAAVTVGVTADGPSASPGDLARHALLLLAAEPEQQPVLRAFLEHPPAADQYADPLTVLAAATAAFVVVQSYVKIERKPTGQWSFKLEKKPPSLELFKVLVGALSRYFGGKPPAGSP
jgi:hypothetical protein